MLLSGGLSSEINCPQHVPLQADVEKVAARVDERPSLVDSEGGMLGIPLFQDVKVQRVDGDGGDDSGAGDTDWVKNWTKFGRDTQEILTGVSNHADGGIAKGQQGTKKGYGHKAAEVEDEEEEEEELQYEFKVGEGGDDSDDDDDGNDHAGEAPMGAGAVTGLHAVGSGSRGRRASTLTSSMILQKQGQSAGGVKTDGGEGPPEDGDVSMRGGGEGGDESIGGGGRRNRRADNEEQEEVDDEALNGNFSDFKRGKRFRKLTKMLGSAQVCASRE